MAPHSSTLALKSHGGAWCSVVHRVTKSRIRLSDFTFTFVYWRRKWQPTPVLLPRNPMDGGAWCSVVHGVTKSRIRLSDFTFTFHFHELEKKMATNFSVLAWRIPGTGESGVLPSRGSRRVRHDWSNLAEVFPESPDINKICVLPFRHWKLLGVCFDCGQT